MFKTITDVRAANRASGQHWFSRKTMGFFNSRIESRLYGGRFFVTSERMELTMPKRYSVREALPDGDIKTVGNFQNFIFLDDARDLAKQCAKAV